jgi:hypothetical protein
MEYLKISKLTELDFDTIFNKIGGSRFSVDHSREGGLNCDYKFRDSLVELKLIEEEPSEKKSKQEKLSQLFEKTAKTIVLDPNILEENEQRKYYRLLEVPIKTALKKASKQLKTSAGGNDDLIKIAIIINNGLSLMLPEEFEQVALKCAKNDTSGIDIILIGGLYFLSDKFDSFVLFDLKEHYLRRKCEDTVSSIRDEWYKFINEFMTRQLTVKNLKRDKEPLKDISFNIGDILYVKPPPKMEKPSSFWPGGVRPREDSTGFDICPPVAMITPAFEATSYGVAKASISDNWRLKNHLFEYLTWQDNEVRLHVNSVKPLVPVLVPPEKANVSTFKELTQVAIEIFNAQMRDLIERAAEFNDLHQSLDYILLSCMEIGIDKANDISFISHEREIPGIEKSNVFIEGERLKFEHALGIAAAHCIRVRANCVYYEKDETYKWV